MKNLLLIIAIGVSSFSFSQNTDTTKVWDIGGQVGLNASGVAFYNWGKGGDNNLNGTSFFNVFANRNINGWSWENTLDLELGMKQTAEEILKKTDDKIELNTKLGKKSKAEHWYYTGYLNMKTQFFNGFDYDKSETIPISGFLSPGYITMGPAMDYKPNDIFSAMISPTAYKETFVLDQDLADKGEFGVAPAEYDSNGLKIKDGENIRHEIGLNIVLRFKKDIFKNVNLETKLDLFSDYLENPENIDVDWQTSITMKVNDFLNVVFKTHLIYDDNTNVEWEDKDGLVHNSPITQFKQSLAVGLMYKF